MDEVIWVEILSRQRDVVARYRCTGPEIRVGRGYDNDVVVDDPFVAPHHIRVFRDEAGALVAEDLGSASGLFAARGAHRLDRIVLDGDRPIRIGHTTLRIRDAAHAVAPERTYQPQARRWPLALGLAAAIGGIEVLNLWLNEVTEPRLAHYLVPLLAAAVFVLGWTALWAILSRIFSGQARFERNLLIALAGLLTYSLYNEFVAYFSFAFSLRALTTYQYVGMWGLFAAICFFQLREIGQSRLVLKGTVVAALAGIAIAMQALSQFEMRAGYAPQVYARHLMPPALRLTPLQTETAFFARVEQLKDKLDRDRSEEPLPPGIDSIFESPD